ncbi:hypothetical protein FB192DRAFT_1013148 [Mucor lusitanicus]|uniref:PARP-type domain-containing protein n=2 Tax=Mucor circinelloides f. lusitanicus TaxID=29924 RepID=A0A8H4BRP9_MUCCL|nr:hypothetical protein FB192DRAFT_1013148 [Mucor lusitanicus]
MVYLIEYAKSDRSVCKGPKKSCVSDSNHIAKGALRLGVETDIGGNVRLTWRHWLCTTPKVLANMREAMSEPEEIQGFDAIREEDQDRIRQAWADGELPEDEKKDEGEEEGAQGDHEEKEEEEKPESSPKSKDAELPKTADK